MKNGKLEIAVVGAGKIAKKHLEVLTDCEEIELVALVDLNPQMLDETGNRFDVENRLSSIEPLLDEKRPDGVFVLVSVLNVADVAAEFIGEGIPTFMEKPPGIYAWQTRDLAKLARKTGTLAMVGVNRRFYSANLKGRELLLESGPIRTVTVEAHEDLERMKAREKFSPEVLRRWSVANGIHALDLLRFFGGEVSKVTAVQRTFEWDMPDACTAIIEYENGALGRGLMDWTAPGGHRFEVRSAGATLTSEPGFGKLTFRQRGAGPIVLEYDEIDRQYKAGFYRQDHTFLDCIRTGEPLPFPACDLDDATRTMEMINQIVGTS